MSDLEPIKREDMHDGFLKLVEENTNTDEQAKRVIEQCWMLVRHYTQADDTPEISSLCSRVHEASAVLCNPNSYNLRQQDLKRLIYCVNQYGVLARDQGISVKKWNDKLIHFKQYIDKRADIYIHCPLREFTRVTVGLDNEERQKSYNTFLAHRVLTTLVNQSMSPPTQSSSSPPDSIQELYETVVFPVLINGFHVGISLDKGAGGLYG